MRWPLALATILIPLGLCASVQGGEQGVRVEPAQASGRSWSRHHVLFVIDSSGSFFDTGSPSRRRLVQRVIQVNLAELLRNGERNGFGTDIYNPALDESTSMAFGMARDFPCLRPDPQRGFFRTLWTQRKGRTLSDLAAALPTSYRHWTASTVAISMAVPQLRWELEQARREPEAFERTFLVVVTDDELNATGLQGELRAIRGAIDSASERRAAEIDHADAAKAVDRLTELYALTATADPTAVRDDFPGFSGFVIGPRIRVRIRELKPLRTDGIDSVLAHRPDRVTELTRDGGLYTARLRLEPAPPEDVGWPYDLLGVDVRMPDWSDFQPVDGWSPDAIELPPVELTRDRIPDVSLDYRLHFVRRDPVYGEAIQVFQDRVTFRAEPTERILGVLPVADWMMGALPGLSQQAVRDLANWAAFGLFLLLLAYLLVPRPRPSLALVAPSGSKRSAGAQPIVIDFNRLRHQGPGGNSGGGHPILLRTLRLSNEARRFGRLPRFERRFYVELDVRLQVPRNVRLAFQEIVGLSGLVEPRRDLPGLAHNSEVTVGLWPDAFADYSGRPEAPAICKLRAFGHQVYRPLWKLFLRHRRKIASVEQDFKVLFLPETPEVAAEIRPVQLDELTGDVASAPFPAEPHVPWLIRPHHRGGAEPVEPELEVAITAATDRVCSIPRSAQLKIVLYKADQSDVIEGGVDLERAVERAADPRIGWTSRDDGSSYCRVTGITPGYDRKPLILPIFLDYYNVQVPPPGGADYVVKVHLLPEPGEEWPLVTRMHGIRIGPDPREAGLMFAVGTVGHDGCLAVATYDPDTHGRELRVERAAPVLWSVGTRPRGFEQLARIRVDNLAPLGSGEIRLTLEPRLEVRLEHGVDPSLEPIYAEGRGSCLQVGVSSSPGGEPSEWWRIDQLDEALEITVPSEALANARPVEILVRMDLDAVKAVERQMRRCAYLLRLPFHFAVQREAGGRVREGAFDLTLAFALERDAGDHVLAVDFGTSAVVVAFGESTSAVERRVSDVSDATLDLQARYLEVLVERDRETSKDDQSRNEADDPNLESGTPFLPSQLTWREGKTLGAPGLVELPPTLPAIRSRPRRTVYYLKSLILRGDRTVPDFLDETNWVENGEIQRGHLPVDGLMQSAYGNLIEGYVTPILKERGREELLDKMVFAYPNNFSLGHEQRLREVLSRTFHGRYRVELLSESKAVALYCCYPLDKSYLGTAGDGGTSQHVLVYDIGAGTLDATYARLDWGSEAEAYELKTMKILYQAGLPVAGDALDEALARVVDSKIRQVVEDAGEGGLGIKGIEYVGKIVDPEGRQDDDAYQTRMIPLKTAIHRVKVEMTERSREASHEDFTVYVPIDVGADVVTSMMELLALADADREKLQELGVKIEGSERLLIPLSRSEILAHPAVEAWLFQVTDEFLADFAGALRVLGVTPTVDKLVLSGRTSQFPPFEPRLVAAVERELGIPVKSTDRTRLTPTESKEAVALGSLLFAILQRSRTRFEDRMIWARYGIVYETGAGHRFEELFSYATEPNEALGDRVKEIGDRKFVLFKRRVAIHHVGNFLDLVVTFSHDPKADVADPDKRDSKFTVVRRLGRADIGSAPTVTIEVEIDAESRLNLVIDPEAHHREIPGIASSPAELLPQQKWPYTPLRGAQPMPRVHDPRRWNETASVENDEGPARRAEEGEGSGGADRPRPRLVEPAPGDTHASSGPAPDEQDGTGMVGGGGS